MDKAARLGEIIADHVARANPHPQSALLPICHAVQANFGCVDAQTEAALAKAVLLKAAANAAGIPVVLTNVEYGPQGAEGGQFFRKVPALRNFFKGSPLGAFADGMEPGEGE